MKLLYIHRAKLNFCFCLEFCSSRSFSISGLASELGGGGWEERGIYTGKVPLESYYLLPLEGHPVSL